MKSLIKKIRSKPGKKVLVAMSGGVDSSVSALLLKKKGYEVVGATMCLGVKDDYNRLQCCGVQAIEDAKKVCRRLQIPHYVFDFSRAMEKRVIDKFVNEYSSGRTPNPCIDCNRYLKFDILLKKALGMGFDYLATGHYAKITKRFGNYYLSRPRDRIKDQTYFLYPIKNELLKYIKFPLSKYTKKTVREIAQKLVLPVANKPQSQDLCFMSKDNYTEFFKNRLNATGKGPIVDLNGKILGMHKGVYYYTIGQRKGLGLSSSSPFYVIEIDPILNKIIVGDRSGLKATRLEAESVNYHFNKMPRQVEAKIRYNHNAARCSVIKRRGKIEVVFHEIQEAITPGQSVVIYWRDLVIAGGEIKSKIS